LGYAYFTGRGLREDWRRAQALFVGVCNGDVPYGRAEDEDERMGRAAGCLNAGLLYEASADRRGAAEYYGRACASSEPEGWGCDDRTRVMAAAPELGDSFR